MTGSKLKQWFVEWWLLLVPATFALGAVTTYAIVFRAMPATENPAAWGTFGDFIGGLMNPLVSVLTLFVAISVWRLQKAELELTRSEMAQTKEAMEDQAKTAEQQRREQRFFDLLNIYNTTVSSIAAGVRDSQSGLTVLSGKEAVGRLVLDRGFRGLTTSPRNSSTYLPARELHKVPKAVQELGLSLDHYFRVVFTVLREAKEFLGDEHVRYVKLFRAQLCRGELEALALNLIFDPEGKKLRPLIEQYGILKHLQDSQLRRLAEEELNPGAFGRNWVLNSTLKPIDTDHAP